MDKETKEIFKSLTEDFKRYNSVLYEKFQDEVKTVAEQYGSMKNKLDATFELVGEIKEDAEMMKIELKQHSEILKQHSEILKQHSESLEIIKLDVGFIKNSLKKKVDLEEFEALEKRVTILESKLARV